MKIAVITLALLICLAACEGATTTAATTCQASSSCSVGQCCRDSNNQVLGDMDYPWGPWGGGLEGQGPSGTCVTGLAQQGEVCDSMCQCAAGLECYRPMSGACCPPQTCMDAAYVQQQRDYWANCHPPHCYFPP